MPDVKEVINALEMSYKYSNVDEDNTLVPQWIVLHAIELLKAQEYIVRCKDCKRRLECDYYIENGDDWFCADGERR